MFRKYDFSRSLLLSILILALCIVQQWDVSAAASFTFKIEPVTPVAGQKAVYDLYTWITGLDGKPDLSSPFNMVGYPFDVRAYIAEEFPGRYAPDEKGIPIRLNQIEENRWRGEIVFPEAGSWVIVLRNAYPPLTSQMPPPGQAILEVNVIDPERDSEVSFLVIGITFAIILMAALIFLLQKRYGTRR